MVEVDGLDLDLGHAAGDELELGQPGFETLDLIGADRGRPPGRRLELAELLRLVVVEGQDEELEGLVEDDPIVRVLGQVELELELQAGDALAELDLRQPGARRRVAELVGDLRRQVDGLELEDVGLAAELLEREVVGRRALEVGLLGELGRVDGDHVGADALLEEDGGRLCLARIGDADVEVLDVLEQLEGDVAHGFEGERGYGLLVWVGDDLALRKERDVDVLELLHEVEREDVGRVDVELGQLLELLGSVAQGDADELLAAPVLVLDGAGDRDAGLAAHETDQGLLVVDLGLEVGRLPLGEVGFGGQALLLELEVTVEVRLFQLEGELGALQPEELHALGFLGLRGQGEDDEKDRGRDEDEFMNFH